MFVFKYWFYDNRLAGATLMTPVVNYWWHGLPYNMSTQAYYEQPIQDQWALRVAHYVPWLTFWWFTQNWFPTSSVVKGNSAVLSPQDLSIVFNMSVNKEHRVRTVLVYIYNLTIMIDRQCKISLY